MLPLVTDKYFDSSYRLSGLRSQGASAGRSPTSRGCALGRGQDSEHRGGVVQAAAHDGVEGLVQADPGGHELGLLVLADGAPVLGQQAQVLGEEDPGPSVVKPGEA